MLVRERLDSRWTLAHPGTILGPCRNAAQVCPRRRRCSIVQAYCALTERDTAPIQRTQADGSRSPAMRYLAARCPMQFLYSVAPSSCVHADTVLELCLAPRIVEVQGGTKRWSGL